MSDSVIQPVSWNSTSVFRHDIQDDLSVTWLNAFLFHPTTTRKTLGTTRKPDERQRYPAFYGSCGKGGMRYHFSLRAIIFNKATSSVA